MAVITSFRDWCSDMEIRGISLISCWLVVSGVVIASPHGGLHVSSLFHINRERMHGIIWIS